VYYLTCNHPKQLVISILLALDAIEVVESSAKKNPPRPSGRRGFFSHEITTEISSGANMMLCAVPLKGWRNRQGFLDTPLLANLDNNKILEIAISLNFLVMIG